MDVLTQRKLLTGGVWLGWIVTLSPLFGLSITAFGMWRAFDSLGGTGISDPKALSSNVAMSLISTATGLFLFPFGLAILLFSISVRNRLCASMPPPLPQFHDGNPGNV